MRGYPNRWAGAIILALAAFTMFLDLHDGRIPWSGLAAVGIAIATGAGRADEEAVVRQQGWRIALLVPCTIVIVGRVFWRWV